MQKRAFTLNLISFLCKPQMHKKSVGKKGRCVDANKQHEHLSPLITILLNLRVFSAVCSAK